MPQARALSASEKLDWLRLIRCERVGPITFYKLLERFATAKAALDAIPDLAKAGGAKIKVCPKAKAEDELAALDAIGATLIAQCEPDYPPLLALTEDAPPVLAVLGHVHLLKKRAVAIVGARNASINGKNFAGQLARDLGQSGLLVVSGLARGIDGAAHAAALDSGTIGVLGGGVDVVYPKEHQALYEEMAERGAVISEVEPATKPQARHFPRRNRIICGMARGTVVVEASPKSGSLITARMAAEFGREVFAVPGSPQDPRHQGTNALIREGATLVQSAQDILDGLKGQLESPHTPYQGLDISGQSTHSPDEKELHQARPLIQEMLSGTPVPVDEVLRNCQFSPATVSIVLLELELAGRLERHPGHRVSLVHI